MTLVRSATLAAALLLSALTGCSESTTTSEPTQQQAFGQGEAGCGRFFPAGKPPQAKTPRKGVNRSICFRSFVIEHSSDTRTAVWSAELVTRAGIDLASARERVEQFHPEASLPADERAELEDYRQSGYDRGHLTPEGDMPSDAASYEAFSLANMAPQAKELNRRSWAALERAVRRQARAGDVYVVTGPLFFGKPEGARNERAGRVLIPSHFWKAIYAPDRGAAVFVATNSASPKWSQLTIDQFQTLYEMDPFPGVDAKYRSTIGAIMLDAPSAGAIGNGADGQEAHTPQRRTKLVKDPVTQQWITIEAFQRRNGRMPRPDEYEKPI